MKYILIIFTLIIAYKANSQNIAIYNAYINERPKTITPAVGNITNWSQEPNVVFELSYDIADKIVLGGRYYYYDYPGHVGFEWTPSDKNIQAVGLSIGAIKMRRFGVFSGYVITNAENKLQISTKLQLDYQSYIPQFKKPGIRTKVDDLIGNNYFGPDRGETFLTTYETWQILPSIGFSISYRPFWKVVLHAEAYYSHGFVPHSRMEFEYTDLEVEQPTSEFVGNGTSFNYSFGLGFRLWE